MNRWKGVISIVLFISMKDLKKAEKIIYKNNLPRIQWHLYIHLKDNYTSCDDNYIVNIRKNKLFKECYSYPIFPINLLRYIGLSTIQTTHYLVVDADLQISSTLQSNFNSIQSKLLNDEKNVFLIPTFMYNMSIVEKCREKHNCQTLWNTIPHIKRELYRYLSNSTMTLIPNPYHVYTI